MSAYGMSAVNCTVYPDLEPNPDISGIGVLLGFFITAYLSFLGCALKLFLSRWEGVYGSGSTVTALSLSCRTAVISLGDQQLVTGISILIAGFLQLEWGIPVYHWQSVVNQAWLSTVTYFMVFTAMKDDIHKSRRTHLVTCVRIGSMFIPILLLSVALWPMGYTNSQTVYADSFPAWCFYHKGEWRENIAWQASNRDEQRDNWKEIKITAYNYPYWFLAIGILLYNFISRVIWLQKDHSLVTGRPWKVSLVIFSEKKVLSRLKSRSRVSFHLYSSLHALLVSSVDVYSSALWEMTWVTSALVWGTLRVAVTRQGWSFFGDERWFPYDILEKQDTWSFGQVVPMLLLVLPITNFIDTFATYKATKPQIFETPSTPTHSPAAVHNTCTSTTIHLALRIPRNIRFLEVAKRTFPNLRTLDLYALWCRISRILDLWKHFPIDDSMYDSYGNTDITVELRKSPWYFTLNIVQYLLTVGTVGLLIIIFTGPGGLINIVDWNSFRIIMPFIGLWALYNFFVLYVVGLQFFSPVVLKNKPVLLGIILYLCLLSTSAWFGYALLHDFIFKLYHKEALQTNTHRLF